MQQIKTTLHLLLCWIWGNYGDETDRHQHPGRAVAKAKWELVWICDLIRSSFRRLDARRFLLPSSPSSLLLHVFHEFVSVILSLARRCKTHALKKTKSFMVVVLCRLSLVEGRIISGYPFPSWLFGLASYPCVQSVGQLRLKSDFFPVTNATSAGDGD